MSAVRRPMKRSRVATVSLKIRMTLGNVFKDIHLADLNVDCTILDLGDRICAAEGIDPRCVTLVYPFTFESTSERLRCCAKLSCSQTMTVSMRFKTERDLLRYASSSRFPFLVFVRTLTGKCLWIAYSPTDSIAHIKAQIFECEGLPGRQQRLMFRNAVLNDYQTIEDYAIGNMDSLNLVLRLL